MPLAGVGAPVRLLRTPAPAAALLLLASALAATAQVPAVSFSAVGQDDAANGRILSTLTVTLGYVDANANGRADPSSPAEPVYLDLDNSRTVTYGDVRLTPLGRYPAGSTVDVTNHDLHLTLVTPHGWVASTSQGAWLADLDANLQVSAGDVRLSGTFGEHVDASAGDRGAGLQAVQQATPTFSRVGYLDQDSDGRHDATEPLVFDLEPTGSAGSGRVSPGDLRLQPAGPGLDDGPSRAEFEALAAQGSAEDSGSVTVVDDDPAGGRSAWGLPETVLLLLGVANLAGLAVLFRRSARPRNPFK